jgi:DNA-binding GntR family transcriptional regulator
VPLRAPRHGESSYRLLTQLLREQIFRDEFDEVRPLPTELALARDHHLSRQTVRRAFQELVAEGLVYRVQGRGTFVTPRETRYHRPFGTVDDLLNLQVDTDFELVEPLSPTIDRAAATTLRLDEPQVHALRFLRRHHGDVFCLTRVCLPPRIAQSLAGCAELTDPQMHATSTVTGLIESHGNDIAEAEQVITAMAADQDLAAHLRCATGSPILHIERTYLDRKGEVLEHAVSDFLPEYYSHRSRLGRSLVPDPAPDLLQE